MDLCSDPSNWLQWLPPLFTTGAALVGAGVAVFGLKTWRHQIRGKVEYETARKVLRAVLEVRECVAGVRAAFISVGEMLEAFDEAGIDPSTVQLPGDSRTDQLVYVSRWKPLSEAITQLESEGLEAEVLWGSAIRSAFGELRRQIATLRFAVDNHLRKRSDPSQWSGPISEFDEKQVAVLNAIGNPDTFRGELDEIISKFEEILRPHLSMR